MAGLDASTNSGSAIEEAATVRPEISSEPLPIATGATAVCSAVSIGSETGRVVRRSVPELTSVLKTQLR